jgi:hypothetical protein
MVTFLLDADPRVVNCAFVTSQPFAPSNILAVHSDYGQCAGEQRS